MTAAGKFIPQKNGESAMSWVVPHHRLILCHCAVINCENICLRVCRISRGARGRLG